MNKQKYHLQSQLKSTGTAYLLTLFVFGTHYGYLGKWGIQILFWITLYGVGVWYLIDLFRIPGLVARHNAKLWQQIDAIEKKERADEVAMNLAILNEKKRQRFS